MDWNCLQASVLLVLALIIWVRVAKIGSSITSRKREFGWAKFLGIALSLMFLTVGPLAMLAGYSYGDWLLLLGVVFQIIADNRHYFTSKGDTLRRFFHASDPNS